MHELIYSQENKYRILRHGIFCMSIFFCSLLSISIVYPGELFGPSFPSLLSYAIHWTSLIVFFCYITVYVLVPVFMSHKKYISFLVSMLILFIFMIGINYLYDYYQLNKSFRHVTDIMNHRTLLVTGIIRFLGNPPLVCVLLLSLKSLKNWHLKKEENESLTVANTNAELQLLKSQIHPHFLFNTLNNIYSHSLSKKSSAADLVNKLKHTVHYMVAECNHSHVPLKNELNMIANYIDLERIRYGNRLSMQAELINPGRNYQIAPLLILPFIENCFKHGVSQIIEQPKIMLKIYMNGNTLYFQLSNSRPALIANSVKRKGVGLENVKKRLELLYPGKHKLRFAETEDMYTVQMEIVLTEYSETENGADIYSVRKIHKN